MSCAITIGNGNLLVGIDDRGQLRDFYYPFAGHANHVSGASGTFAHRLGIWVDGRLSWLHDEDWHIELANDKSEQFNYFIASHPGFKISLTITDAVHNEKNIYLRTVKVTNLGSDARDVRIFFGQEFRISESRRGDTAYYDPRVASIIHYKGHDAFLIHAQANGVSFNDYSVGLFDIEGKIGTYTDAEDGVLSKNTIEHGSVDSVIGLSIDLTPEEPITVDYWIAAGHTIKETHELHHYVVNERPECLIASTHNYWHAWLNKETRDLSLLDRDLQRIFKQSLELIRVHADNRGGIIASSDSDMLNQGRDTYSYVWPRDAAISASALDHTSYFDVAARFYSFMAKLIEPDGYLMHKYRVDGVLGSSWHPWLRNGKQELPIQEDETALVITMLGRHFKMAKDVEFIESIYNSFIEPAADFMHGYIEEETGLPASSYDLWEEKYGSSTYTAATVYSALNAAADISATLGKRGHAQKYRNRAELIKEAILTYLYDVEMGAFIKLLRHENGNLIPDKTIDMSSFHGIVAFGVLDALDKRVLNMKDAVEKHLKVPTPLGGYMRYEGDRYYRSGDHASPNPWCITTLWMAQYLIKAAQSKKDLELPYGIMRWTYDRASQSGVLPEQINPYTGAHLSAAPLVWSHSEFVITALEYINRYKGFQK